MNRSGRSEPAGPATTPHASSGWSAAACATIAAYTDRSIFSTEPTVASGTGSGRPRMGRLASLGERADQRVLHPGQPLVHGVQAAQRIVIRQRLGHRLVVLVYVEPGPDRQPQVIEHAAGDGSAGRLFRGGYRGARTPIPDH